MTNFDWISHNTLVPAVLPAGARAANHTGPTADMLESDGQSGLYLIGTLTATAVVTVEESDDASTWTAVTAPATSSGIARQLPLNLPITASATVYGVNFTRSKRYVRAVVTGSGHTLAGHFIGHAKYKGN